MIVLDKLPGNKKNAFHNFLKDRGHLKLKKCKLNVTLRHFI